MTNGTQLEIGKRPVMVPEFEIIRAGPQVARKEVSLLLQKTEVQAFIPPSVTPLPTPTFPPSPLPQAPIIPLSPGKNPLIINIETLGFKPWEKRIVAIGFQDPSFPSHVPTVIMHKDEAQIINDLFTIIKKFGYNQFIGYGNSFDLRFIVIRAMKLGINCKEFVDMELYDLMQAMAQVKFEFVYKAQQPPKLSDIADFFWGYPKPFTDLEMMKFYKMGLLEKVKEFASSQITRILLLYYLFRKISETSFIPLASGLEGLVSSTNTTSTVFAESKLTIPEAHNPETWLAKCPNDLSEHDVPMDVSEFRCPIDGTIIKRQ